MQTDFELPLSRAAWITGAIGAIGLVVAGARATAPAIGAGGAMTAAAHSWIATLDTAQKERAVRPFDEASRVDWHFIPKPARKGVQLRDMTPPQQTAALALLRAALSQAGYDKSVVIMELDEILRILEGAKAKNIRDPKRYFFKAKLGRMCFQRSFPVAGSMARM
ncbi:MAG: DUF3500 domain-containing protein [Prosthecobacter sp.]